MTRLRYEEGQKRAMKVFIAEQHSFPPPNSLWQEFRVNTVAETSDPMCDLILQLMLKAA